MTAAFVDVITGETAPLASALEARALTEKIKVGVEGIWHLIEQAYTTRAWAALGYSSWDDYCTREFGTSRLRLPREERPEVVASLRESGLSIPAIAQATGLGVGTVHRSLSAFPNGKPEPQSPGGRDSKGEEAARPSSPRQESTSDADRRDHASTNTLTANSVEDAAATAETTVGEVERLPFSAPSPTVVGTDGKSYPATRKQPARPRPLAETSLNTIESLADRAAREAKKLTADQIRRVKPNAAEWIDGIRNSIEVLSDLVCSLEEN